MEPTLPGSGTTAGSQTAATKPPTQPGTANADTIQASGRTNAQDAANLGNSTNIANQTSRGTGTGTGYGNSNQT